MNEEKKKRVLVACPTLGLDPDPNQWLNALIAIQRNITRMGFDQACIFPYRQTWWDANNQIWNLAFEHKFDYILRLDDDIHSVPDGAFSDLLAADKDVIGAAYPNRRFPFFVSAMDRTKPKSFIDICLTDDRCLKYVVGEGVVPCELVGFGMTLIKTAKFKFLERPMYRGQENVPDDTYFAQVCLDNNIKQFVHMGVKIAHRHVTFDNAGYLYNAEVMRLQRIEQAQANAKA